MTIVKVRANYRQQLVYKEWLEEATRAKRTEMTSWLYGMYLQPTGATLVAPCTNNTVTVSNK